MKKICRIKIPGKVILIGEYAVLEGAPSVVMAVNRYVYIDIFKSDDSRFMLEAKNFGKKIGIRTLSELKSIESFDPLFFLKRAVWNLLEYFQSGFEALRGYQFSIDSKEFYENGMKMGFGSSAAVLTGLVKAVGTILDKALTKTEIFHLARKIHYNMQTKTGSGVDISASVFGGVLKYRIPEAAMDDKFYEFLPVEQLPFLIVWSGSAVKTGPMIQKVKNWKDKQPEAYNQLISRMSEEVNQFTDWIRKANIKNAMVPVENYFHLLNELGRESGVHIISDIHRTIHDLVRKKQAYYKPSGAGGGDIGIVLADTEEKLKVCQQMLEEHKYQIVSCSISAKGVEYEDCY
jgi:phosphomevalonate kinase